MKTVCLIILSFLFSYSFAQHDHGSHGGHDNSHSMPAGPPNGGMVKESGKYKIEMVVDLFLKKDQIKIFLYKGNYKPIDLQDITGEIEIIKDETVLSSQKLRTRGDYFVANIENPSSFTAKINLLVKGKKVNTLMSHKGLSFGGETVYTCSMHPEIESKSPGKCPKCGMNLIEKENNDSNIENNTIHNHNH